MSRTCFRIAGTGAVCSRHLVRFRRLADKDKVASLMTEEQYAKWSGRFYVLKFISTKQRKDKRKL